KSDLVEAEAVAVGRDAALAGARLGPVAPLEVAVKRRRAAVAPARPFLDVALEVVGARVADAAVAVARAHALPQADDLVAGGGRDGAARANARVQVGQRVDVGGRRAVGPAVQRRLVVGAPDHRVVAPAGDARRAVGVGPAVGAGARLGPLVVVAQAFPARAAPGVRLDERVHDQRIRAGAVRRLVAIHARARDGDHVAGAKAGRGVDARARVDRGGRRRGRMGQAALDGRRAGTASGDGDARREAGGDVLARAGEAVHAAGAPVDPGRVGRGRVG